MSLFAPVMLTLMLMGFVELLPELVSEIRQEFGNQLHRHRTLHWQELAQHWGHLQWQAQVERARRPFIRRGG